MRDTPKPSLPSTVMRSVFGLRCHMRLRRHHVHHFRCADAERQRAERAVRRRVRIGADDEQARLGDALLGRHDMQYALARIVDAEKRDAVLRRVRLQAVTMLRISGSLMPSIRRARLVVGT